MNNKWNKIQHGINGHGDNRLIQPNYQWDDSTPLGTGSYMECHDDVTSTRFLELVLLLNRPVMSVPQKFYEFYSWKKKTVPVSFEAKKDFLILASISPLFHTNFRREHFPVMFCSDSSMTGSAELCTNRQNWYRCQTSIHSNKLNAVATLLRYPTK